MPGTVLGSGYIAVNKTNKNLWLGDAYIHVSRGVYVCRGKRMAGNK